MTANDKGTHLSLEDRKIIETGISNGSTKTAIAKTLGKGVLSLPTLQIGQELLLIMSEVCAI